VRQRQIFSVCARGDTPPPQYMWVDPKIFLKNGVLCPLLRRGLPPTGHDQRRDGRRQLSSLWPVRFRRLRPARRWMRLPIAHGEYSLSSPSTFPRFGLRRTWYKSYVLLFHRPEESSRWKAEAVQRIAADIDKLHPRSAPPQANVLASKRHAYHLGSAQEESTPFVVSFLIL